MKILKIQKPLENAERPTEPEAVYKEISTLLLMADRWLESDLANADCDGTEDWILEDYIEKLSEWMIPYFREICRCNPVTDEDHEQFTSGLKFKVDEMRRRLQLPDRG